MILKYLILLIPFSIFAQKNMAPDTIFTVKGRKFPCIITSISNSNIQVVLNDRHSGIGMKTVQKISFDVNGTVYNKEIGFTTDIRHIQQLIENRNKIWISTGKLKKYNSTVIFGEEAQNHKWANSIFIAGGFGYPQGLRLEVGYNLGEIVSLGLTYTSSDYWSRNPSEGKLGLLAKFSPWSEFLKWSPYIFYNHGRTFSIFGGRIDKYNLFYFGSMIPLQSWLHFRPEAGIIFTSKYISGGSSWFGEDTPEIHETKTRFGINLSFEIDL